MTIRTTLWILALLALLAPGCKNECEECECDDDDDDVTDDDDDTGGECAEDGECDPWEICEDQACIDGDRNNDFDEAVDLDDGDTVSAYINPDDDVDYYAIDGQPAWFFRAYALTEDPTDDAGLDTVIRFWDDSGDELGYNDDFERLSNIYGTDAVYMGCTPSNQTWFLSVEDYADNGSPDHSYDIVLEGFEDEAMEKEPNDTPANATDAGIGNYNISYDRAGVIDSNGDLDLWELDLAPGTRLRIYGYEDTATELTDQVRMLAPDGESTVATYSGLSWALEASVPVLDDGPLFMEVTDPGGYGGDDYCYVLHLAADPPGELFYAEVEPNDDNMDAGLLQENDSSTLGVAGRIDPAGDVDRFIFLASIGDSITVTVRSQSYGSQLEPHVLLLDPTLAELASYDVPLSEDPFLEDFALNQAGTYTIEVSSADPQANGTDHWYALYVEVN